MEPLWLHMHKPKGAVEGAEGAICLNGSPGSLKSSLSFVCVCILGIKIKDNPPWLTHLQEMIDPLGWMDSCNHSLISKSYTYSMRDNVVVRIQLSSGFATKNYQEKDLGHLWLCCWDLICIIEEKRLLVDVSSIYAQVIQTGTSS